MSDQDDESTHHVSGEIAPLKRRPKPAPKRPKTPDPTNQELYELHKLSQEAAADPEELAKRLGKVHEGLKGLDGEEDDLPPAG